MSISRIEKMKIIGLLEEFSKLCDSKSIKFGKYSEEELMEFLMLYRAWKRSGPAPF